MEAQVYKWSKISNNLEISESGIIRNITTKKEVKPYHCGNYLKLHRDGIHEYVHRLVAKAFIDNPKELREVNHKDCNTHNNAVSNLEWCSRKQNNAYRFIGPNRDKNLAIQKELSQRKKKTTHRHSDDTKRNMSLSRKHRRWVHNNKESKMVLLSEIEEYLIKGYSIGRGKVRFI